MRILLLIILVIELAGCVDEVVSQRYTHFNNGLLVVAFSGNSQGLSGIRTLSYDGTQVVDTLPGTDAFLNWEHTIAWDRPDDPRNWFAPRSGLFEPKIADSTVVWVRDPLHDPWRVGLTLFVRVRSRYIDFCIRADFSQAQELAGGASLFFANYLSAASETLYVMSQGSWVSGDTPNTHPHWDTGGSYHHESLGVVTYHPDHNAALNLWSYEDPQLSASVACVRLESDLAFIYMLDQPITLSMFKFKPNRPAADFRWDLPDPAGVHELRGRIVVRPWTNLAECAQEYLSWDPGAEDFP